MKNNVFILFLCCMSVGVLYGYISSHVGKVQNESNAGRKVNAADYDLRGAQLPNVNAQKANFNMTKAQPCEDAPYGVCIPKQTTTMIGGDFTGADFSNGTFRYVDFGEDSSGNNSKFTNATAYNTDFSYAYFKGADFSGFNVVDFSAALSLINEGEDASSQLTMSDLQDGDAEDIAGYSTTVFCNATMPDGTSCTGVNWTDSSTGIVYNCNCANSENNSGS